MHHGRGEYARHEDGDGFCEVHVHTRGGKSLSLSSGSVGANATGWVSVIPDSFLPEAMERTGREPVPSFWSQVRPAARPSTAHSDSALAVAMSSRGASPCVAATQASRLPEVWCGLTPPQGACQESRTRSREGQHAPCWSPSGLRLRTHDPPKHSTRGAQRRGGRVSGGCRSACG